MSFLQLFFFRGSVSRHWTAKRLMFGKSLRGEQLEARRLLSIDVNQMASQAYYGASADHGRGPLADVGWDLAYLYAEHQAYDAGDHARRFAASNTSLHVVGDAVEVNATASGTTAAMQAALTGLGMQVNGVADNVVSGLIPIDQIPALAALKSVAFADPAIAIASAGAVTSQGDVAMQSNAARKYLGLDGTGVTVGVISTSYNALGGAAQDVQTGDLPSNVNVIQDYNGQGANDEGRAMLQIIHDVAPGASLAFATGEGGDAGFKSNVAALENAGAKVIVDDLTYADEPMFQDGSTAQAVESAVSSGVTYLSAAGNAGQNGFESAWHSGPFLPAGYYPSVPGAPAFRGGTTFDFAANSYVQPVTVAANATLNLDLQWDSPFKSGTNGGSGSTNDLDVYLLNLYGQIVAGSTNNNVGADPWEYFSIKNTSSNSTGYYLMITNYAGTVPGLVKYVMLNSSGVTVNEYATNSATIYGHGNASNDAAVGAAYYGNTPAYGVSPPVIEPYSSVGSTEIRFDQNGNPITPFTRNHPDFVAPDGVDNTFFGADTDSSGFPNFFGTSAAAPHAAAVAALMLQSLPSATPSQIYSALDNSAVDMAAPGYDQSTGFGLIQAPQAITNLGGQNTVTIDGTNDPSADAFKITRSGAYDQFYVNNSLVLTAAVAGISKIVIKGSNYNDSLTIDASGGDTIPSGGVTFNAASGANSLTVKADANMALGNGSVTLTGDEPGTVSVSSVSQAVLTELGGIFGPRGPNSVTINGWQGTATANPTPIDSASVDAPSGSSGNILNSHPTTSTLAGTGYSYTINGASVAARGASASDTANLYDDGTQTSNNFYSHPTYAGFYGSGFSEFASNFGTFTGTASNSGDGALLLDDGTQSANNFYAHPTYAGFYGTGFSEFVSRFQHVNATASNAGDGALLLDDGASGANNFYAHPTYAAFYSSSFNNYVSGFQHVNATASYAGDTAQLLDDGAPGANTFYAHPTYAAFYSSSFNNYVSEFQHVDATASYSGDTALLLDDGTSGANSFYAHPTYAAFYGSTFNNYVSEFQYVNATASNAGDVALLLDDGASGVGTFYTHGTDAALYGTNFNEYVANFRHVSAVASGASDVAAFYDMQGNNTLDASGSTATYYYANGAVVSVTSFSSVYAYESAGYDTATQAARNAAYIHLVGAWH